MGTPIVLSVTLLFFSFSATVGFCGTLKGEKISGKKEFEKHCASCHPNGGNIVNNRKTLNASSLKVNGVKGSKDIIAKIRKPGPGMTSFDEKTISNREANAIADYVLKTFK